MKATGRLRALKLRSTEIRWGKKGLHVLGQKNNAFFLGEGEAFWSKEKETACYRNQLLKHSFRTIRGIPFASGGLETIRLKRT